jgi:heme oxygenase
MRRDTARDSAWLEDLKQTTRPCHERLEQRVDIMARLHSRARYRELLECYLGFYAPLERALSARQTTLPVALDLPDRWKAPLLRRDLAALGATAAEIDGVPHCSAPPDIGTPARALGCLYVLEGATLGGRIIARPLADRLGIDGTNGGAFFHGYGERTGSRWTSFRRHLTQFAATSEARSAVIAAAIDTFEALDRWLAQQAEWP